MRLNKLLIAGVAGLCVPAMAQEVAPPKPAAAPVEKAAFDAADAARAVTDLAAALEENFVFPDKGKLYAAMLRANLAAGKYAAAADADGFAGRVTDDLQAVHKDGHLQLRPVSAEQRARRQAPNGGPPTASAVAKTGWLAEGTAYIDLRGMPGNDATLADVRKFLAEHGTAKNLIIDVRRNGGGGLAEMNLIFSEIFAKPTTLVTMDIRRAVEERQGAIFGDDDPLMRKVSAPDTIVRREHFATPSAGSGALKSAKVYLLTSKKTFSAAEHLSLSLKRTHRATLIGEATGGGAHFGGMVPMGSGYAAFIPAGRTFDPDTGQSWEGTGVAPDIAVPADEALDEALRRAGVSAGAARSIASLK